VLFQFFPPPSVCEVLESSAGHASWSEESGDAVLRRLHVSVGHLPLLACSTQWIEEQKKMECNNGPMSECTGQSEMTENKQDVYLSFLL